MIALPLAAALLLLGLPGWAGRWDRRLDPRAAARWFTGALVAGFAALLGTLLLAAAPLFLQAVGALGLAALCQQAVERLVPGGPLGGWLAAGIGLVVVARGAWGLHRARSAERAMRVEPWLGVHEERGTHRVVLLPTAELVALSLPGRPGQVLVSEGLVGAVTPEELEAVLAHELAHLRHHHRRYLMAAEVVEEAVGFLPPVRKGAHRLRLALERWADEEAAVSVGGRSTVLAALERVAMSPAPGLAAFGAAETVAERVHALAVPPVDGRSARLASWEVAGLFLVVLASWGLWLTRAGSVLASGPLCLV